MPRAKERTPELKDRVLRVAVATLAAEGVAGFTTRKVAGEADTSTNAVYELFGDKAGLVREIFFEGFRLLHRRFDDLEQSDDPMADLVLVIETMRVFARENPVLTEVMFSRPFAHFDPAPSEAAAGTAVREFIVATVRRCLAAGALAGDATDVAQVILALTLGLAAAENASRLGSTAASADRRWDLAVSSMLVGLRPQV